MTPSRDRETHQLKAILEQAEELFLSYGIRSAAMDDIARRLGLSKKTLYQYVENKDDLVMRMTDKLIEEESAEIDRIFSENESAVEQVWRVARIDLWPRGAFVIKS